MKKHLLLSILLAITVQARLVAQEWMNIYHEAQSTHWMMPILVDSIDFGVLSADGSLLATRLNDGFVVPMATEIIDSLGFYTAPEDSVKDKYQTFQMFVFTEGARPIDTRDSYIPCYISLNARGSYSNRWVHAGIRGRGNSTWNWYDKKPYRIKLD